MKKHITLIFFLLLISGTISFSCTTAVISGKYTKNGRPMLWKHRDTNALNNKIVVLHDGKFSYTGLVNSADSLGKSIWIGFNEKGFAIMNSASYNLNNDTINQSGLEGRLMKKALQTCATIDDFENMLKDIDKPSQLEANFGLIDAKGGAAYFELGNFSYVKFDANDPKTAPYGYILRTNYSVSGKMGIGGGYIRYETAEKVFNTAVELNQLSPKTIIQNASRNLTHSLTRIDLADYSNLKENTQTMVYFEDFIPRKLTSSSIVIEGVKEKEKSEYTTMWTVLGWPLGSVAIPVWLNKKAEIPGILQYNKQIKDAPMCAMALEAKKLCFPYNWGTSSKHYMDGNALLNADNSGVLQLILPLENLLFEKADKILNNWRINKIDINKMKEFYDWVDTEVPDYYNETLHVNFKTSNQNNK